MSNTAESASIVDQIVAFNGDRKAELVRRKFERMNEDAFAFFRGTDHLFASNWARLRPADEGPGILACGDLHLENFGAYRTDDGEFRFDINDFDEALVAGASLDLVRCTTSILLAAETWSIAAVEATGIALEFLNSYRRALAEAAQRGTPGAIVLGDNSAGPIRKMLGDMATAQQAELLDRHTELKHGKRRIVPSDDKHPPLHEKKAAEVAEAIEHYGATTPTPAAFRVLDVTGRILGIGSLGTRRYMVLVAGGDTPESNRLLDVKEETASSVLACSRFPQPDFSGNEAARVVAAQRQLQSKPCAGLAVVRIDNRDFRIRELIANENRAKLDRLQKDPDKLRQAVSVAGQLTAWSQMRGCEPQQPATVAQLTAWAAGPAVDSVLTSATAFAEATCRDFRTFAKAYAAGKLA